MLPLLSWADYILPCKTQTTLMADMETSLESLSAVMTATSQGMDVLSSEAYELAKISQEAAKVQLAAAIIESRNALDGVTKSAKEAFESLQQYMSADDFSDALLGLEAVEKRASELGRTAFEVAQELKAVGGQAYIGAGGVELINFTESLSENLKITEEQAFGVIQQFKQFEKVGDATSLVKLAETISELGINAKDLSPDMAKLVTEIGSLSITALKTEDGLAKAQKMLDDFGKTLTNSSEPAQPNGKRPR